MAAYLSTPVDSAQLMDGFFFFFFTTENFFATRAPELTLSIFFMKAPCCIFLTRLYCVCEAQKSIDSFDVM